jgi:hypothetical protein
MMSWKRGFILVVVTAVFVGKGAAALDVSVPDAELLKAFCAALAKPVGPVTDEELATVYTLAANDKGISDLTGIQYCTALVSLSLFKNNISNLQPLASMPNLATLDLSWNSISSLGAITSMPKIADLNLSHNPISSLAGLPVGPYRKLNLSFMALTSLTSMPAVQFVPASMTSPDSTFNLASNQLQSLSGLPAATAMIWFDATSNRLTSLAGLSALESLRSLRLADNQLTSLAGLPSYPYLVSLEVSENSLTSLSSLGQQPQLNSLSADSNPLTSLAGLGSAPNLQYLYVRHCRLTSIQGISSAPHLYNIYLSYNELASLDGLGSPTAVNLLDVSHNRLTTLAVFGASPSVRNLDVGHNNLSTVQGISQFLNLQSLQLSKNHLTSLAGLPATILFLSVSDNPITTLRELSSLTSLTNLGADNLALGHIPAGQLPVSLTGLVLSNDGLTDAAFVTALPNLAGLYLPRNRITALPSLGSLTMLHYLDLSDNLLTGFDVAGTLGVLETINLSHNRLSSMPDLTAFPKLNDLYLSHNLLATLPDLSSRYFSLLDLSNNAISSIPVLPAASTLDLSGNVLAGLPATIPEALGKLDVSKNLLSSADALGSHPNLWSLDMSGNQISSVTFLTSIPKLSEVFIDGNPTGNCESILSQLGSISEIGVSQGQVSGNAYFARWQSTLETVWLSGTSYSDLVALAQLHELRTVCVRNAGLQDISALAALKYVGFLDLSENALSDISPLAGYLSLGLLNLANNNITDISPLPGMPYCALMDLSGNNISNIAHLVDPKLDYWSAVSSQTLSGKWALPCNAPVPILDLSRNPLGTDAVTHDVPYLKAEGVNVALKDNRCSSALTVPTGQHEAYQSLFEDFAALDANGDHLLSWAEISGAPAPVVSYPGFEYADGNGAGSLSQDELLNALYVSCEDVPGALAHSETIKIGENVLLVVPCPVWPLSSYQWTRNGNPLADTGRVIGAKERSMAIAGLTKADSGRYTCTYNDGSKSNAVYGPIVLNVVERLPLMGTGGCMLLAAAISVLFLSVSKSRKASR